VTLKLTAVLTSFLEPFPAEITQAESQLVRFTVSHWFLSPYSTESQKTTIKLASRAVESYTKRAPQALTGSTLTYGPYKDVAPWAYSAATVHSVNNKPFAKFSNINREIEVSHWGNVAIEETYELKHAGARLAGGFSRFDYKGGRTADSPSFRSLTALLPSQARDIYYRDQIGNISTSDLRKLDAGLEMEIQTRYPMFGGWQSQFYIGYNVPSETMLFVDSVTGRHNLKVDYFVPFDDVWVEDMEIKVVLPEGCSDVKIELPYAVEKQTWTTRFTYLDSVFNGGRKVLTLKASNLVEEFDKKIVVSYSFSRSRMLFEPLLLCVFFFFLFGACSLFARLNTVLEGKGDKKSKSE
jgi:oligosaccharyltransferase complex subunit alpha (ribophorin I)